MQLRHYATALAVALLATAWTQSVSATVVTVAYYRLGENDPSAASPNTGNAVTIGSPGSSLTRNGSPTYTNSVASSAAYSTGSNLAVSFSGTSQSYTSGTSVTSATNNFGIEAWVRRDPGGAGVVAVNGSAGDDGWGIAILDGEYVATYANEAFFYTGEAADTNWHHVALVRDGGVGQVYLDGDPIGSSFTNNPHAATVGFGIGADPTGFNYLEGSVDEVRVFTFTAGQFVVDDLLYSVPEPSGIALAAIGCIALFTTVRLRRKRTSSVSVIYELVS